ncbi:MAG: DUF4132 domain-containing protein [Chthoniobacteraceae bacterium]
MTEAERLIHEFRLRHSAAKYRAVKAFKGPHDEVGKQIMNSAPRVKVCLTIILFAERANDAWEWSCFAAIQDKLLQGLLRKEIPLTDDEFDLLLVALTATKKLQIPKPISGVLTMCEAKKEAGRLTDSTRARLQELWRKLHGGIGDHAELRKLCARISSIAAAGPAPTEAPLERADAWAALAEDDLPAMPELERDAWRSLFTHSRRSTASNPTNRWNSTTVSLIEGIGSGNYIATLERWFREVRPLPGEIRAADPLSVLLLREANSEVLKGLVWGCAISGSSNAAAIVADLAAVCYRKIPGRGPLSPKIGNACLVALEKIGDANAVAQLSRLRNKIKYVVAQRLVERALEAAATRAGLTVFELEEISLPTFGPHPDNGLDESLKSFTAEIRITPKAELKVTWRNEDGETQKSVPAEVKNEAADEWKELKRTLGEIGKLLEAQRHRIEQLFRFERVWNFPDWEERYLNHPLVAPFARRLIWRFADTQSRESLGIWCDGHLVGSNDQTLPTFSAGTVVSLWHPILSDVATITAWRNWLIARRVSQPTKQAHREVYLLTDAERTTRTYSNRFAAHILRQHQFAALAQERGWKYKFHGGFDSANTPGIALPEWNLHAEYWVEPAGDFTQSGGAIHTCLSTDQVRFLRDAEPLPLADIPPLIFSEIMRDVDLFVGVTSVGNDPAWADGGRGDTERNAWAHFSFGDLSATAQTRRDLLERLVPKLKIASRCSFAEKFLVVRGDLRTYKIHLGSGNILMSPNDRYLCIVAGSGKAPDDKVFLPFEGDRTLSVILSKAFLLAADAKITDPTIVQQLKLQ